jgi:hypothetical protein
MMMKSAKVSLLSIALLAALLPLAGGRGQVSAQSTTVNHQSKNGNSTWDWTHSDNGVRTKVRIKGEIEFNDDYTQITSISTDGSLSIQEERGGVTRKFEATRAADGSIRQIYFVQGEARPLDNEAQTWLNRMLLETVRQSGYGANPEWGKSSIGRERTASWKRSR